MLSPLLEKTSLYYFISLPGVSIFLMVSLKVASEGQFSVRNRILLSFLQESKGERRKNEIILKASKTITVVLISQKIPISSI